MSLPCSFLAALITRITLQTSPMAQAICKECVAKQFQRYAQLQFQAGGPSTVDPTALVVTKHPNHEIEAGASNKNLATIAKVK